MDISHSSGSLRNPMPGCLGPKKSAADASHAGHPCLEVRPAARKALPMPRDLMGQVKIQKCGDELSHDFRLTKNGEIL